MDSPTSHQPPLLITGAGKRIGLAFARHWLQQGKPLIATYRTERPAIETLRQQGALCLQADFATDEGVSDFIARLREQCGALRGIIHNASDWLPESPQQSDQVVMQRMMQVHAFAPYRINLACEDLLLAGEGPRDIVHMTDYVVEKGSAKHIAYAASKAALANLTLSFARKLAPRVKVNSLAPSLILFNEDDDAAYREKTLKKSLLQLEPGVESAVQALQFLLDSPYITGRSLPLDGGRPLV
ncbi:MAG: dihydromonapterin reductase [Oleiphilaceae bacterium]|nr:dihydromonapterin reductase [Oleiphilaceae bacterium]